MAPAKSSFELDLKRPLSLEIARLMRRELGAVHEGIGPAGPLAGESSEEAILRVAHDARKRCKKLRAILRLGKPALGKRWSERSNHALRDASRTLSPIRDAEALVLAWEKLAGTVPELDEKCAARVQSALTVARHRSAFDAFRSGAFDAVRTNVDAELALLAQASMRPMEVAKLEHRLRAMFKRAREAHRVANSTPSDETLHEWRKHVKYVWYQLRLLGPAMGTEWAGRAEQYHRLASLLGEDHDLALLRERLLGIRELFVTAEGFEHTMIAIEARRHAQRAEALVLGRALFETVELLHAARSAFRPPSKAQRRTSLRERGARFVSQAVGLVKTGASGLASAISSARARTAR